MMRDIKFRFIWQHDETGRFVSLRFTLRDMIAGKVNIASVDLGPAYGNPVVSDLQYTGLKDKNGSGLIEVYEGDIIRYSKIIGNIYETDPRKADLVIPRIGTKSWHDAYKEAVVRGFDYAE